MAFFLNFLTIQNCNTVTKTKMTPPRDLWRDRRPLVCASKEIPNAGLQNRQNRRIALAGCGLVANVQVVKYAKIFLKMPEMRYIYPNMFKNLN